MEKYFRITQQLLVSYISMFFIFLISPLLPFVLTRSLTLSDFGAYSLFAIAIEILIVLFDFGFPQFITTRLSGQKDSINSFFSIYIFETVIVILLLALISFSGIYKQFLDLFQLSAYSSVIPVALIIIILGTLIRLHSAFLISKQKLEKQSILDFMNRCLWIIFLIIAFIIGSKISVFFALSLWAAGLCLTYLLSLIWIVFTDMRQLVLSWSPIRQGLLFGLPLLVFNIGAYIIAMSDRYMLSFLLDNSVVGLYSLAYSLVMFILSLSIVVPSVFYPYIAEKWNKKENFQVLTNASLKYGLVLLLPATFGLFAMKIPLITLISGTEYIPAVTAVNSLILFPLFAFFTHIFYLFMLLRNKTKIVSIIYLSAAVINLILNYLFISHYGMAGAGIATVISYFLMFLLLFYLNGQYISFNYDFLRFGRILISSLIMASCVYLLNPQIFLTKILTVIIGIVVYGLLLLITKAFVPQEKQILLKLFKLPINLQ